MFNQIGEQLIPKVQTLHLHINVDGIPLFKSTKMQLWLILGKIADLPKVGPFVIALFSSTKKPSSLLEYLEQFVMEMKSL